MRLVACPSCHTQYDVTDVALEKIPCPCGTEVANVDHEAVDATVHRCGSCGAIAATGSESCPYCGSEIERVPGPLSLICPECFARCAEAARFCTACGVAFQPQPVPVEGQELPCPDCDLLMPRHQVGGVGVNECHRCHGLWVPGEAFDLLLTRAVEARREADPEKPLPTAPRVVGANPASQGVRYRKCPECMAFMQRRNYRKSSGVIIDVCHQHGTWLDADELEQIAGFVLSGRTTSTVIVEETRKAEVEGARWRAEARMAEARIRGVGGMGGMGGDRHGGVSLLRFLIDLLD